MSNFNVMSKLPYEQAKNYSVFDMALLSKEKVVYRRDEMSMSYCIPTAKAFKAFNELSAIFVATLQREEEVYKPNYLSSSNRWFFDYTIKDKSSELFGNDRFSKTRLKLESYINLKSDWDGYGAVQPEKDIIDTALSMLDSLKMKKIIAPKPMITGAGEVSLYWDKGTVYIEIAFDEAGSFSYLIDEDDEGIGEDDIPFENKIFPNNLLNALKNMV